MGAILVDRIYVVAGNFNEALGWVLKQGLMPGEWSYVCTRESLRGLDRGRTIYGVGSWRTNSDILAIEQEIISREHNFFDQSRRRHG